MKKRGLYLLQGVKVARIRVEFCQDELIQINKCDASHLSGWKQSTYAAKIVAFASICAKADHVQEKKGQTLVDLNGSNESKGH